MQTAKISPQGGRISGGKYSEVKSAVTYIHTVS